jgi:hypothetical protein
MSAGEKLQALTDLVDEMVRDAVPGDDGERWALLPTGEVVQLGLFRRRPNGTVWFEGTPVAVPEVPEEDEFGHLNPEAVWRDAVAEHVSTDLNRVLADHPAGTVIKLNALQLAGLACARCGISATSVDVLVPMVPVSDGSQLFVCDPDCRKPAAVPNQSEQMQARIAVALQRAERICEQARSIVTARPDRYLGAARRIESGPLPDDVWALEVFGGAL